MDRLPRFAPDATADEVAAAVLEVGGAIIERAVDAATCDRLAAELAPHLEATPVGGDDFAGRNTKRPARCSPACPRAPR